MVDKLLYSFTAKVVVDRTTDYRDLTVYGYAIAGSEGEAHEKVNEKLNDVFHSVESIVLELSDMDVVIV